MHFKGQPFTKNVVLSPGPSQIAIRLVSSIKGVFIGRAARAKSGATENAAVAAIISRRVITVAELLPPLKYKRPEVSSINHSNEHSNRTF